MRLVSAALASTFNAGPSKGGKLLLLAFLVQCLSCARRARLLNIRGRRSASASDGPCGFSDVRRVTSISTSTTQVQIRRLREHEEWRFDQAQCDVEIAAVCGIRLDVARTELLPAITSIVEVGPRPWLRGFRSET